MSFFVIDQFTFSPGRHIVNISYDCENGLSGVENIFFEGEVRPSKNFCIVCVHINKFTEAFTSSFFKSNLY